MNNIVRSGIILGMLTLGIYCIISLHTDLTSPVSPKFKEGDCVFTVYSTEKWEKPSYSARKILKVGEEKYLTMFIDPGKILDGHLSSDRFFLLNRMDKVECDKIPDLIKELSSERLDSSDK